MSRGDLTDTEWRIFDPLLPDRGERGPSTRDKRRTVNGILWSCARARRGATCTSEAYCAGQNAESFCHIALVLRS